MAISRDASCAMTEETALMDFVLMGVVVISYFKS